MTTLYHYTDAGHAKRIEKDGHVRPGKQIGGMSPLSWFTDLETPDQTVLGLTSHLLPYDRTTHRFRVTNAEWVKPWKDIRKLMPARYVAQLETPGTLLMHWWVAALPVPVVLDQRGATA